MIFISHFANLITIIFPLIPIFILLTLFPIYWFYLILLPLYWFYLIFDWYATFTWFSLFLIFFPNDF